MKAILLLLFLSLAVTAGGVSAQQGSRQGAKPPSQLNPEDRQRLREDVDAARASYGRQDNRGQERMTSEERAKLRQDVRDANRDLRRDGRR